MTSGGSSLGGAIIGGALAGTTGAIIGSCKKTETSPIVSEEIKHDTRKTVLKTKIPVFEKYQIDMSWFGYDTLMKLIPEKEYSVVQELKKNEAIQKSQSQNATSIPEQIRELAKLRDDGILSEEEFGAKKGELLAKM